MSANVSAKLEQFFSQYRLRRYSKGQVLILSGENTNTIYHLIRGQVKVYDITYRGDEVILNIFQPPAFFPMSLAINNRDNPYVYAAETDVEIRQAPAAEVIAFIKDNPDVLYDLLARLYRGVDGMMGRMSLLMSGSARSRLLYEIVIETRRFYEPQADGSCRINLTEKTLGSHAGLSRETVSRELQKLKHDHLIEVHSKYIMVNDVAAIETLLEQTM